MGTTKTGDYRTQLIGHVFPSCNLLNVLPVSDFLINGKKGRSDRGERNNRVIFLSEID